MIPDYIFDFVGEWEGWDKVTNHPADKGGLTKYGISQAANPDIDIERLTKLDAKLILKERYWDKSNCKDLFEYMQLVQFNCAVNCGVGTARKILQRTVGAYPDGKVGVKTRAKIALYENKPRRFLTWYLTNQSLYYFSIVLRRREQEIWLKGWMRRTFDAMYITAVNIGKRQK